MKKLLVTGISGFLGNCLATLDQQDWQITGLYHNNPVTHPKINTLAANLEDEPSLQALFQEVQPDAVIHLAALSQPNFCEKHPQLSHAINVGLTASIARLCKKRSIPLVFTSTDLVFDGQHGPYNEQAIPEPVNLYGQHKVEAEQALQVIYPEACIARCPVMFGQPDWGNSFMKSWLDNLRKGKEVYAFEDEYRTKVSGKTAVEGLLLLLNKSVQGIWHLGGKERCSRYDFAIMMAEAFGLPTSLVISSKQADVQMAAKRPADVSLDSSKAYALGYNPPTIKEALSSSTAS